MFRKLLGALLCAIAMISCEKKKKEKEPEQEAAAKKEILRVYVSADNPPYEFINSENNIDGFDIDLIKAVVKSLEMDIEIKNIDFSGLIPALQSKACNMVISNMNPSEERRRVVDFSIPYLDCGYAVLSLDSKKISNSKEMDKKIIGVQMGSLHEGLVKKLSETMKIDVISLPIVSELIQNLKDGRVDGIVIDEIVAKKVVENSEFFMSILDDGFESCIAFPKDEKLLEKVNKIIESFLKDGTIDKLKKKHGI
jgi:arginine/lysine/histidine transporter system substrate-binding protein